MVVGWPAVALAIEAWRAAGPADVGGAYGGITRPLDLARETGRLVLATEAIALPAGVALGFVLFRTDAWGRRWLLALVSLAVFVPMPLLALAWLGAFGNV